MDLLYRVILISVISRLSSSELISLASRDHVLCITDDLDSALFMYPPITEKDKNTSILIDDNKFWEDGWMLGNSKDHVLPKVLDKRWEDFEVKYTKYIEFDNVVSVSTSTTVKRSQSIPSDPPRNNRDIKWLWSHFQANLVDSSPFTYEGKSEEVEYWKVHDYKVRWANRISEKETKIVVNPEDTTCLMMYLYMDANCSISISSPLHRYAISHHNMKEPWKAMKFDIERATAINIKRTKENGGSEGLWVLDIRQCPDLKQNKVVLEKMFSHNNSNINRSCATLPNPDRILYPKESPALGNIFGCAAGLLGVKCDIRCEDFLGRNLYCEYRKICDGSKCLCSWGYEGELCNMPCSDGSWGLSCQKKCSGCDICNKKTGDCSNSAVLNNTSGMILTVVLAVMYTFL